MGNYSPVSHKSGSGRPGSKRQSFVAPVIFLSLLTLLLAVFVGLLLKQALKQKEFVEVTEIEKEDITAQKDALLLQLTELESAYENLARLNADYELEILAQKEEIQHLRSQIRRVGSPEALALYIARIEDMNLQFEGFQEKIHQLEAENRVLSGENVQIRSALSQISTISDDLQRENRQMAEQIDRASILSISEVQIVPFRETRRGERETLRARRAEKLRICLTIPKNLLAHTGDHEFFFQITGPDNQVLENEFLGNFEFSGQQIKISHKEDINYQNVDTTACIVFDFPAGFEKGGHQLRIFSDRQELWRGLFELN